MFTLFKIIHRYIYYCHAFHRQHRISEIRSTTRRVAAARQKSSPSYKQVTAPCELDSHADTIVAGANCAILHYTGKVCDVAPYRDDYQPVHNIPIVAAATAWQSPHTGQVYILILNEALWMGESMNTTLINPNQLRHFGTRVQDNPTSDMPLSIITEDETFSMELQMSGTIVSVNTYTPSQKELETCPHVQLSSPHPWDPHKVTFPKARYTMRDAITSNCMLSAVTIQIGRNTLITTMLFSICLTCNKKYLQCKHYVNNN